MLCSPAEIEKKRQNALQKLAKKNQSPVKSATISRNDQQSNMNIAGYNSFVKSGQGTTFLKAKPYEKMSPVTRSPEPKIVNFYGQNKATVTINLIMSDRFCVKLSSYFLPIIEILKTIPSKSYDPKTRIWNFHIKDYNILVSKLKKLKSPNLVVEELPKFVLNCIQSFVPDGDIDSTQIDRTLFETLLPFQLESLQFGVQRGGRCLIADDMGLGKTFQSLAIMNYYKNDWPLLIVTTASMKNVWEQTIFKYLPSVSIMQVQYMVSGKDYIGHSSILIVSHDLMSRGCDKLLERGFGCIVIDESHNLKNYKAKMTQAAIKLCKQAKRVVLLSGTPALSRPKELYTQLSLIDDTFFGSFVDYANRYCDLHQTNFGFDSSGKSNLEELAIILKKKFMIRRRKEDVLGSLPKKTKEVIKLNVNLSSLDDENKELLQTLSTQFISTNKTKEKHSILLTFFCETAKIKIPSVCSHVQKVVKAKKKFLVFAHHLVMLDAIETVLKSKDCKYIRIDGSTSGEQRKYFVDQFQTDENCLCALLSITAANAGITLTAGQLVVFAELHWNPSILNQAEARVHRIGQENDVLIQYLLADGTADDHIWPLLEAKQNILQEMGLTKESFLDIHQKYQNSQENSHNIFGDILDSNIAESDNFEMQTDEDSILNDGFDDILCNIDL